MKSWVRFPWEMWLKYGVVVTPGLVAHSHACYDAWFGLTILAEEDLFNDGPGKRSSLQHAWMKEVNVS